MHTTHTHTQWQWQAHTHAANVFAPSGNKNKFEKLILNVLHWKHIVWQPPTLRLLFTLTLSLLFSLSLSFSLLQSSSLFLSPFARLSHRLRWFSTCLADNQASLCPPPCGPAPLTHPHIKTATRRRRAAVRGLYPALHCATPPRRDQASIRWP